jgi:Tfp pilus assembly protein PilE
MKGLCIMRIRNTTGFTLVEGAIVVVVVGLLAGGGYIVYAHHHKKTTTAKTITSSSTASLNQPGGTPKTPTEALNDITGVTSSLESSEANVNNQYSANDQTSAQSSNTATSNMGGAYNEANF